MNTKTQQYVSFWSVRFRFELKKNFEFMSGTFCLSTGVQPDVVTPVKKLGSSLALSEQKSLPAASAVVSVAQLFSLIN